MEILNDASDRTRRTRHTKFLTRTVAAIRHVHFEDLGTFGPLLRQQGYEVAIYDAGVDDLGTLTADDPELLVVLGGPIGANDQTLYPFLNDEYRIIEKRLAANRPTIGICLGAQLIASFAGGRVLAGPKKEIGWSMLSLTEAGKASAVRHLDCPVLHWHGDTFELPHYAERLASTPLYENQAFALGRNVLGLQFHSEVDDAAIERWLIGHACELGQAGIEIRPLREDTLRYAAALRAASGAMVRDWLAEIDVR